MIPLVLIPGMMCDERLFTHQTAAITTRPTIVSPITNHDNVEDLASEILNLQPEKFALAGLSMGGIVAMEVLRQAPNRVERLCLMDTNPLAEIAEVKKKRQPQIEKVKAGLLSEVMRNDMLPHYLFTDNQRQDLLNLCLDMALSHGEDVFIKQSIALKNRPDQSETLRGYKGKTLILQGVDDRLCPNHRHELMHSLLGNSNYIIIKKAGHLPTLEQPQTTNKAILDWLTK